MRHLKEVAESQFISGSLDLRLAQLQMMLKELGTVTKNIRLLTDKAEQEKRIKELAGHSGVNIETLKLYIENGCSNESA